MFIFSNVEIQFNNAYIYLSRIEVEYGHWANIPSFNKFIILSLFILTEVSSK